MLILSLDGSPVTRRAPFRHPPPTAGKTSTTVGQSLLFFPLTHCLLVMSSPYWVVPVYFCHGDSPREVCSHGSPSVAPSLSTRTVHQVLLLGRFATIRHGRSRHCYHGCLSVLQTPGRYRFQTVRRPSLLGTPTGVRHPVEFYVDRLCCGLLALYDVRP